MRTSQPSGCDCTCTTLLLCGNTWRHQYRGPFVKAAPYALIRACCGLICGPVPMQRRQGGGGSGRGTPSDGDEDIELVLSESPDDAGPGGSGAQVMCAVLWHASSVWVMYHFMSATGPTVMSFVVPRVLFAAAG